MDLTKPPKHLTEPVRKALRSLVNGQQLLEGLEDILLALDSGYQVVKQVEGDTVTHTQVPLTKEDVARLNASASIRLALLRKVLPDLKVVELVDPATGDVGERPPRRMSDLELAARLVRFHRDMRASEDWMD